MQPNKKVIIGTEGKNKVRDGVKLVANSVRITLGPVGKNVAIGTMYGAPIITNDGVTIANSIRVKDRFMNMGVELAKITARKTDGVAGDGTTTTLILLSELVTTGLECINAGTNVIELKKDMNDMSSILSDLLKKSARKVETREEMKNIAYISVENEEIANLLADIFSTNNGKGEVVVTEVDRSGIQSNQEFGLKLNKGLVSPYPINNPQKMQAEYEDCAVLFSEKKFFVSKDLIEPIKTLTDNGVKNIVIVADEIDGEALASFEKSFEKGTCNIIPIKFSTLMSEQKDELEDFAVACNTVAYKLNSDPKHLRTYFARIEKVIAGKDSTLFVPGEGKDIHIARRTAELQQRLLEVDTEEERKHIGKRLSTLSGLIHTIKVGAESETDRRYLKLKIDDAVNAVRGAIEEGIIEGGGYGIVKVVEEKNWMSKVEKIRVGHQIVLNAVIRPYLQLLSNSNQSAEIEEMTKAITKGEKSRGYDARNDKFVEDLFAEGIVDPVKVTTHALKNAVSTASILLTTEALIDLDDEDKDDHGQDRLQGDN